MHKQGDKIGIIQGSLFDLSDVMSRNEKEDNHGIIQSRKKVTRLFPAAYRNSLVTATNKFLKKS